MFCIKQHISIIYAFGYQKLFYLRLDATMSLFIKPHSENSSKSQIPFYIGSLLPQNPLHQLEWLVIVLSHSSNILTDLVLIIFNKDIWFSDIPQKGSGPGRELLVHFFVKIVAFSFWHFKNIKIWNIFFYNCGFVKGKMLDDCRSHRPHWCHKYLLLCKVV